MKKVLSIAFIFTVLLAGAQHRTKTISKSNSNSASREAVVPPNPLYTFSTFTAAYQSITGISLSNGLKWDDDSYPVPLGFNFKLYNKQNDSINFSEGSYASTEDVTATVLSLLSPVFEDLCDRAFHPATDTLGGPGGISDISYTVTGLTPNRVGIIQVANAGFFGELDVYDTSASYLNFQVHLYEGSNDIEFRYGNMNLQNPSVNFINSNGFLCGLAENVNIFTGSNQSSNVLQGNSNSPAMVALGTNLAEVVTGSVQPGRVYKFSRVQPNPVGMSSNTTLIKLNFFPNPTAGKLTVSVITEELKESIIEFYDVTGKRVYFEQISEHIDLSLFNAGIYLLRVQNRNNKVFHSEKIIITH